jgi:uncharacterized membrane protein YcaP (DUF421 family)
MAEKSSRAPPHRRTVPEPLLQVLLALAYYVGLVVIMRLAGKRLAGQTTTFDLVVLITLGVVLQQVALREGTINSLIFIGTVFAAHRGLALWCAKSTRIRRLARGAARPLVHHGRVEFDALADEGLSYDDLLAGLRKLGHDGPGGIRLATLEETGHISAIPLEPSKPQAPGEDSDAARDTAQRARAH